VIVLPPPGGTRPAKVKRFAKAPRALLVRILL